MVTYHLHIEYLNHTAKDALGQRLHLNPKTVACVGNCIGLFQNVKKQFDPVSNVSQSRGKHIYSSTATDLQKIVKQIVKKGACSCNTFQKRSNEINPEKFNDWLCTQKIEHDTVTYDQHNIKHEKTSGGARKAI